MQIADLEAEKDGIAQQRVTVAQAQQKAAATERANTIANARAGLAVARKSLDAAVSRCALVCVALRLRSLTSLRSNVWLAQKHDLAASKRQLQEAQKEKQVRLHDKRVLPMLL